jgi:RNA polymerase sigma-70 factor (ECF subfamily)
LAGISLNPHEKEELAARARAGDKMALQRLLLAEYDRLAARIRRKLGSDGQIAVEDVIQDTFLRAFRQIERFKPAGPDSFYRWLATIAEHRLTDLFRAASRRKDAGVGQRGSMTDSLPDLLERLCRDGHTPTRSIARHEAIAALQAGLAALPADQRCAVQMRYLEALPVAEVAERLKKPPHAVHMLCYRGLRKLKACLGSASRILSPRE